MCISELQEEYRLAIKSLWKNHGICLFTGFSFDVDIVLNNFRLVAQLHCLKPLNELFVDGCFGNFGLGGTHGG